MAPWLESKSSNSCSPTEYGRLPRYRVLLGSLILDSLYSKRITCDVDKGRAENDETECGVNRPKKFVVEGDIRVLEATRATLACVRKAFANIEAMKVVRKGACPSFRQKKKKLLPRG